MRRSAAAGGAVHNHWVWKDEGWTDGNLCYSG